MHPRTKPGVMDRLGRICIIQAFAVPGGGESAAHASDAIVHPRKENSLRRLELNAVSATHTTFVRITARINANWTA